MAQSAVSAIRTGCQMLSEGKAFIDDAKSEIEGVVGQVKETIETVTGLWGWIQGLFGIAPKPSDKPVVTAPTAGEPAAKPAPKAKKKTKEPERELSYEEFQAKAVHEICENLKVYFEAIRQLKVHCRELEEEALTTEKVADSAIDRIEMEWQMKELHGQLKQAMIYGTPKELGLGAMYQEFLLKYDEILEEQDVARELKLKKERENAWQHEHRREILVAKLSYVAVIAIVALELIGLFFAL
jgi:hypothetical protein